MTTEPGLVVLGIEEDRTAQAQLAPTLNHRGLTYRFITDRKKVPGGCAQLKPNAVLLFGELASDLVITVLDTLAGDASTAGLPVVLVANDITDAPFVKGLRSGLVGMLGRPFAASQVPSLVSLLGELPHRSGVSSGVADHLTLGRLFENIRRTRRTGELVIEPRTASEGRAAFVRGKLEKASFLGLSGPEALKAMASRSSARWQLSELSSRQGQGTGLIIEVGETESDEEEVAVVVGAELTEAEPTPFELTRPQVPEPRPTVPSAANAIRLLLVDDDEGLLRMFSTFFAKHGFAVATASDGQQGAEKAAQGHYDVVLADLNMPTLDGWGMLRLLRDDMRTRELPVAFVSAHDDYRESLKALDAGAQAYISKGTRLDTLVTQVKKMLQPRREVRTALQGSAPVSASLSVIGPQWFLAELSSRGDTGRLTAQDGWASYRLILVNGAPVWASAEAGKFTAEGERAFNAFVASRAAEAQWTPGPAHEGLVANISGSMASALSRACQTVNENEHKLREGQLVSATQIEVNTELYTVYQQVGPKAWLEAARLICEERLLPRDLIARLDMSPVDIEETMRDLMRRGVLALKN
jgi:DNA-binding response OmpR family regulator